MTLQAIELAPVFALLNDRHLHRALLDYAVVTSGVYFVCGHCKARKRFLRSLIEDSGGGRCIDCGHQLCFLGEGKITSISAEAMSALATGYAIAYPKLAFIGRIYRAGNDLYLEQINPAIITHQNLASSS